jgi:ATP-dependent Lhr-like helicase
MSEQSPTEAQIRATLGSVGKAFFERFPNLREVQRRSIPPIAEGQNILVCSATASGKTEAVIAPMIWRIKNQARTNAPTEKRTRFLAIAPTRALVSDLLKRLDRALPSFGWSAGAQTSDHSDAGREPDALVTTPESLDSMLVKRFFETNGQRSGHLLAGIEAVFIDEAHLFDCSVRGDQVLFLLERLRRLKSTALRRGWIHSDHLQVCGASATVSRADELAIRMLGPGASALLVSGARELSILDRDDQWIVVDRTTTAPCLSRKIARGASGSEICRKLVNVFREGLGRKVLLFCPSRAKCDELGEYLASELTRDVDVWVGAHHGSLDGDRRRTAERGFSDANGLAVLVATSTLEVGIDIGDVDVVGLIGPPPDVPALLQRIGRGGRRGSETRVIPFGENEEHAAALGGMLVSAATGDFDGGQRFRNWGVFAQQTASYIKQNGIKGRSKASLVELAEAVWPMPDTGAIAMAMIDDLIGQGSLTESKSRFHLDGAIIERIDELPTSGHANIRSGASVVAVRDRGTGEIIGHVSGGPTSGLTNVGGRRQKIVSHSEGEIIVSAEPRAKQPGESPLPVKYPTVPFLITRQYCREVAKGLGLHPKDAPMMSGVWWHFGGQAIEKLLVTALPDVFVGIHYKGLALRVAGDIDQVKSRFSSEEEIGAALQDVVVKARSRYSRSSFDDFFSAGAFAEIATETLQLGDILEFFQTRKIFECSPSDPIGYQLNQLNG